MPSSLAARSGEPLRPQDSTGRPGRGPDRDNFAGQESCTKASRLRAADRHSIVTDSPLVGFFSRREDVSAEVGVNLSADLGKRRKTYGLSRVRGRPVRPLGPAETIATNVQSSTDQWRRAKAERHEPITT